MNVSPTLKTNFTTHNFQHPLLPLPKIKFLFCPLKDKPKLNMRVHSLSLTLSLSRSLSLIISKYKLQVNEKKKFQMTSRTNVYWLSLRFQNKCFSTKCYHFELSKNIK